MLRYVSFAAVVAQLPKLLPLRRHQLSSTEPKRLADWQHSLVATASLQHCARQWTKIGLDRIHEFLGYIQPPSSLLVGFSISGVKQCKPANLARLADCGNSCRWQQPFCGIVPGKPSSYDQLAAPWSCWLLVKGPHDGGCPMVNAHGLITAENCLYEG